jgi:hypothetical protein
MSWTATEGVVEVHYEVEADLEPACQGPLVAGLRAATARGPTALLFEVKVVKVSAAVANFWVDVVESVGPNLTHMGIVSESVMVRALTGAFSMAHAHSAQLAFGRSVRQPERCPRVGVSSPRRKLARWLTLHARGRAASWVNTWLRSGLSERTGAIGSPDCSRRPKASRRVNWRGWSPGATSFHVSGIDTGAFSYGRTHHGAASTLPWPFCKAST